MTGQYAPFVIAAYGIAGGSLLGIIVWALLDRRTARTELERTERVAARQREASR